MQARTGLRVKRMSEDERMDHREMFWSGYFRSVRAPSSLRTLKPSRPISTTTRSEDPPSSEARRT
jgi:hypothetical protein